MKRGLLGFCNHNNDFSFLRGIVNHSFYQSQYSSCYGSFFSDINTLSKGKTFPFLNANIQFHACHSTTTKETPCLSSHKPLYRTHKRGSNYNLRNSWRFFFLEGGGAQWGCDVAMPTRNWFL